MVDIPNESLVDILLGLISIESVTGEEGPIADHLEARFRSTLTEQLLVRRTGTSLVVGPRARIEGGSGSTQPTDSRRPLVVLAGHLDTVPLGEASTPTISGDRVLGRGASDMKSGLAIMIALAERLDPGVGFADRAYVFYSGEEGPASGNDLEDLLVVHPWLTDADLAILLEPTDNELQLGCMGTLHCRVRFHGKACHSARPWFGLNPLHAALPWIDSVLRRSGRPVEMAGVEYREVLSLTQMQSGTARNVLPALVEVNLNLRYPPDRDFEDAEAFARSVCPEPRPMNSSFDGHDPRPEDVGVEVEIVDHAPSGTIPLTNPFYGHLLESSGLPRTAKQAWTDVACFSALGVAALNWGPGETALAHTKEESIRVGDLTDCYDRLERFLLGDGPPASTSATGPVEGGGDS